MALSKTTQDHEEIRKWAESHGAIPGEVASTESKGEPGILRFMFPKAKNANDGKLKEIEWDDFFEKFDANGLELIYQEVTADGEKSNFNKLVYPENDKSSGAKKGSHSTQSKSASAAHSSKSDSGKSSSHSTLKSHSGSHASGGTATKTKKAS